MSEYAKMLEIIPDCDTIDDITTLIERMKKLKERKILEQKVLKRHKNPVKEIKIDKYGNGNAKTYFQTSAKWKSSKHIRLSSYDAVIDELADYYGITNNNVITVSKVFKLACDYKQNNECPQPATMRKLENDCKRFISKAFLDADITAITPEYLNKYSFELIRRESDRGVAMTEAAFKNYKRVLNLIFGYAVKSIEGKASIIKDNPVNNMQNNKFFMKNCKHTQKAINPLLLEVQTDYESDDVIFTEAELDIAEDEIRKRMKFKKYTQYDGYYANGYAFLLSRLTGMRVAEIMALRWSDIKDNYIWIHAQQLRKDGNSGDYIYCPWTKDDKKHTGKGRRFPLFNSIRDLLAEIKVVQTNLGINSEYVLCHADGEWLKKECYETMLRRLFQSFGYNITNNHALRKSLNSNILIPLGVDVTDRASMLGHSVETNLRYYSYARKDNTDELISLLNGLKKDDYDNMPNNVIAFQKKAKIGQIGAL